MQFEAFCLSLKSDIDRREHMRGLFSKMEIAVSFFDAIEPIDLTFENEIYFANCDFYQWNINQKAVMATFISHMKLLEYSVNSNKNILIIEDDLDYNLPIDFKDVKFDTFDLYNIGLPFSCYAYFVSNDGAKKILSELSSKKITQAYDWELSKLKTINKVNSEQPHFIQIENKFKSNIAPNGYNRY